ncbi:hypothetical protein CFIMG_003913RA [Ceratocystis fimbriata CBS 114723]|uniref:Protoporphyrinogen oxidase n=1 Tax=Ceratocystis fimbriata CBS 114723 TaxID=1035309 RepID=A0A2C5X8E0_9PEZI|nr:hypothetical protein CFIMG_003913RA [Ceratocystis fimbriata CBS 114723]
MARSSPSFSTVRSSFPALASSKASEAERRRQEERKLEEEEEEEIEDDEYDEDEDRHSYMDRHYGQLSELSETPKTIGILGGGITGLSTAYYLARENPDMKITIFEASDRLGGWMNTHTAIDPGTEMPVYIENGPKTLRSLTSTPTRADDYVLADMLISLGVHPCVTYPGAKFVLDARPNESQEDGEYQISHLLRIPPPLLMKQLLHPAWKGWAKSVLAFWILMLKVRFGLVKPPTASEDMTVAEWLRSLGIGKEHNAPMLESMLSAMAHGIYGGDIEKLSVQSFLSTRFFQLYRQNQPNESRMVPVQDLQIMQELGDDQAVVDYIKYMGLGESLVFPGGMQTLIGALENVLKTQPNITILKNEKTTLLEFDEENDNMKVKSASQTTGTTMERTFDKVVSTIFSSQLASIVPCDEKSGISCLPTLQGQKAVSVLNVCFYFDQKLDLPHDYTGVLPLPSVKGPVLGVFVNSNLQGPNTETHIRAHEAPGTKLSVLVGGHHWERFSRQELDAMQAMGEDKARQFLRNFLSISETPTITHSFVAHECIPQHYKGHRATMADAHWDLMENFKGRLAVAGGSYTAIGVLPSIRAGYCIAQQITNFSEVDAPEYDYTGLTGLAQFVREEQFADVEDETLAKFGKKTQYTVQDPDALERFKHLVSKISSPPVTKQSKEE